MGRTKWGFLFLPIAMAIKMNTNYAIGKNENALITIIKMMSEMQIKKKYDGKKMQALNKKYN